MISLFRRLRKSLLDSGSTSKYLLYALGEVLLVVIGILLALQINTWNQNRVDRSNEQKALNNILTDLNQQLIEIDHHLSYEQKVLQNANEVLHHFKVNDGFEKMDSLYIKINSLGSSLTPNPVNTSFNELNAAGKLGLIEADSLRFRIINYYQDLETKVTAVKDNNNIFIRELINSHFLSLSILSPKNIEDIKTYVDVEVNNIEEVPLSRIQVIVEAELAIPKNELTFLNLINLRMIVTSVHISRYLELKERTRNLINELGASNN